MPLSGVWLRLWFKDLASHLRAIKKKQGGQSPLMEKGPEQHLSSTVERNNHSLFIGVEDEAENDDVDQRPGEGQISGNKIKKEIDNDDDELLEHEFANSRTRKMQTRISGMRRDTDS
jgi:hypothetical protein